MRFFAIALVLVAPLVASSARANGVTAHAHVSDLAVEGLPPGDLRDLLSDPAVLQALRSGSVFPDSGYAADAAYGEIAHWEPFTDAYLRWILANHPPPWTALEDRQRVAFLLGMMSHGLSDQVFDSLFMHGTIQYDGSADDLDQYADAWLIIEHAPGIAPLTRFVPADDVRAVLLETDGIDTPTETFERGMGLIGSALVIEERLASTQYETYWSALPWSATHYYAGASTPGSLPHIATFVSAYWRVVWERLHGTDALERSLLGSWPEEGAVNFEVDPSRAECRAMIVFGHAIDSASFDGALNLRAADGTVVPAHLGFQWNDIANAVLVHPDATLAYDTEYVVELSTALRTMDGRNLPAPVSLGFRTRCAPDALADCPPLPAAWEPPVMPPARPDAGTPVRPDSGPRVDAGADTDVDAALVGPPRASCGCRASRGGGAPMWLLVALVLACRWRQGAASGRAPSRRSTRAQGRRTRALRRAPGRAPSRTPSAASPTTAVTTPSTTISG